MTEPLDNKGPVRQPVLDPIPIYQPQTWEWAPEFMVVTGIPVSYKNEDWKNLAHRDQGDRGTCTGMTGTEIRELLYMRLMNDRPTDADKQKLARDIKEANGLIRDALYPQSFSAENAYQWGREYAGITFPSGGFTWAVFAAMVKRGIVLESTWPTSKTPKAVWIKPPPDNMELVTKEAPLHVIDGYAKVIGWDNTCAAIYKYGCVASSFKCYENMNQMYGGDGTFPDPKGAETGAHALCLVGYDENWLYCIHSWGDYCGMLGRISRIYFDKGNLDVFTVLDAEDTHRLRDLFRTYLISANVPANIYLDEKCVGTVTTTPVKVSLGMGKTYTIRAEAIPWYNVNEIRTVGPVQNEGVVLFDLKEPEPKSIIARIFAWLFGRV